jgi:glycosyltransferase involved in cell wall biosynthesis
MSMALPVVLTKGAATGIDAVDGRDFIIRDDDVSIVKAVIDLAQSPDEARRVGNCARDWIVRNASWEAALAGLPSHVGTNARRPLDAA